MKQKKIIYLIKATVKMQEYFNRVLMRKYKIIFKNIDKIITFILHIARRSKSFVSIIEELGSSILFLFRQVIKYILKLSYKKVFLRPLKN